MSSDTLWGQLNGRPEWVPVKSAAAETIPSFAVMRVTGVDSATGALTVAKPDGSAAPVIVNGETMVPVGGFGKGTFHPRVVASFAAADGDPAVGEVWGPAADSWELHTPGVGFTFLGGASQGVGNWVQKGERDQNSGTDCCPPSRGTVYTEVPCSGSVPVQPCIYFGNGNAAVSVSYCPEGPTDGVCTYVWDGLVQDWCDTCPWIPASACYPVYIPCADGGAGMYVPGTLEFVGTGTGSFAGVSFAANSTFPAYGSGWSVYYRDDDTGTTISGYAVYCCAADQWGFVGTATTRDDDGSVCRWCTTNFNGCVIGTDAGGTTSSGGPSGPFAVVLHTDCGTVTLAGDMPPPIPAPPEFCSPELDPHPDLEAVITGGAVPGTYTLAWDGAAGLWNGLVIRVRWSGTAWEALSDLGWVPAVASTCTPAFAATFNLTISGQPAAVEVTVA